MPTFGANDRSRWDTVRALVDHGTYAIGERESDPATGGYRDTGIVTEDGWKTIDMVLHPQRQKFCSSKPPLLPQQAEVAHASHGATGTSCSTHLATLCVPLTTSQQGTHSVTIFLH